MRDELMRRISDALDSEDGVTGDAELSKILSGDKVASRYARDLARVNKWLATWPSTTPEDGHMEALATRIEQRLGEPQIGSDDLTIAPDFDDDDALAEATAALTRAGADAAKSKAKSVFKVPGPGRAAGTPGPRAVAAGPSRAPVAAATGADQETPPSTLAAPAASEASAPPSSAEPAAVAPEPATAETAAEEPRPSQEAPVASEPATIEPKLSLAKLPIEKKPVLGGVHEIVPRAGNDPRSEPDLEPPASSDPGIVLSNPGIELTPEELRALAAATPSAHAARSEPPMAPPTSLRPKKKGSATGHVEGERASVPGAKNKKKKAPTGERFSIPTPEPVRRDLPRFGDPTAPMAPDEPRRGGGYAMWGMLAAAAVVFLGVTVTMQMRGGSEPATIASVAPASSAGASAALLPAPTVSAPSPRGLSDDEAAEVEVAAGDAVPADLAPAAAPAIAAVVAEPAAAARPTTPGVGGLVGARTDEGDDDAARVARRAATVTATPGPATATGVPGRSGGSTPSEDPAPESGARGRAAGEPTGLAAAAPDRADTSGAAPSAPEGGGHHGHSGSAAGDVPADDLPAHPERDRVQAVLAGVTDAVSACAAGEHGAASVYVVVVSSGRVTTATVSGRFAGTPVGSCIARAVRTARFPPFSEPRFEVTYPYSF